MEPRPLFALKTCPLTLPSSGCVKKRLVVRCCGYSGCRTLRTLFLRSTLLKERTRNLGFLQLQKLSNSQLALGLVDLQEQGHFEAEMTFWGTFI